jgi:hypothetical protein
MKKHLKNRGFKLLDKNRIENKTYNTILAKENEFKNKLNEMGQFYGKEISDLKKKLTDANICIENYKENKAYLQENLKRALMRGVVAMNLEAMNILEPDADKSNIVNMTNNIVDFNYFNNNGNINNNNINKITFTDPLPINSNSTNMQNFNNNNLENIQLNSIPSNISNLNNQNLNNKNFEKQEYNFINNDISDINNSNFNQNQNQNIQPEFLEKKVNKKIYIK